MGIPASITDEKVKAELLNANRDNALKVIQTIAGLGFIGTAYLAWRNLQLTEDKTVTDRFSKAVEMLADSEKLEVRLGGIYSLERIARDSKADHPIVMEVLTAFVRARSPRTEDNQKPLSQDIQSTLTVIGRRTPTRNEQTTDLSGADLRWSILSETNLSGANLINADLSGAILSKAILSGAILVKADLIGAILSRAILVKAILVKANLSEADLSNADLSGAILHKAILVKADLIGAILSEADLSNADLSGAKLSWAKLSEADLSKANLSNADLSWANLSKANLSEADLSNIKWDKQTQWPDLTEVAKALNVPEALKQPPGLTDAPPTPDSAP